MILSKSGETFKYDGYIYTIGEQIVANSQSEYEGLVGSIIEIRDGCDKETENETPDIYCCFDQPILPEDVAKLEKTFSALYDEEKTIDDIALDYVVMSPYMISSTSQRQENVKTITVYALIEDWANNDEYGYSADLFASHDEAVREYKLRLGIEANNGIIETLRCKYGFVEEIDSDSYECYVDGFHCQHHFSIYIEKKELSFTESSLGQVRKAVQDITYCADFISQIENWDEIDRMPQAQYLKMISDPELPEHIRKAIDMNDTYWEAYWQSISEVAFEIVRKFSKEASE